MTKYELQYNIFKLMQKIYPDTQIMEVEDYIQKLWKMDKPKLLQVHKQWKELAKWANTTKKKPCWVSYMNTV